MGSYNMALHKTYQLYLQGSAHIYIVVQLNTGCFLFTKLYCSFAIKADGLPRQGQVCCNAPSQKLCRCSTDDTVRSDLFIKYSTTAGILWTTLQCKKKRIRCNCGAFLPHENNHHLLRMLFLHYHHVLGTSSA